MQNNFSICYIFKSRETELTPFLRFSNFTPEKIDALQHINLLPITIPELLSDREEIARKRLDSIYHGRVVEFVNSYDEAKHLPYTFKVFFTEEPLANHAKASDILHISLNKELATEETPSFNGLTVEKLREFYFSKIKKKDPAYKELIDHFIDKEPIIMTTRAARNIYTNCNIEIANSLGVIAGNPTNNLVEKEKNIKTSINILDLVRTEISKNIPSTLTIPRADYLITDFSVDFEYSIHAEKYTKHTLLRNNTPDHAKLAESVTYAKSQYEIDKYNENDLIRNYQKEQYLSSTINTLYAASTLTPEIKLDICNNDLFPITNAMGENIRNHKTKSLSKQMRDFTKAVLSKSNTMLDYVTNSLNKQIKIVSNFPLEWTNLNGLPLMIRHNTSRVFSSPGHLRERLLLNSHEISISLENLNKILVISSFKEGDHISHHLKDRLQKTINSLENSKTRDNFRAATNIDFEPEVIFETASNKEEIITALNKFRYGIVIFDMHGGHSKNGEGLLELSDESLHPYDLVGKAPIPPIVILSACDTSPADRSHFNAANAFLYAGAITVLASTYPINSLEAAIYIERLYKRITYYLPERILSIKSSLRWSEFMTGLNRRIFFEKFLEHLAKNYKHSEPSTFDSIKFDLLHALELIPENFLEAVYFFANKLTNLSKAAILTELTTKFTYCECLNYVQIGFPERIIIVAEDLIAPPKA